MPDPQGRALQRGEGEGVGGGDVVVEGREGRLAPEAPQLAGEGGEGVGAAGGGGGGGGGVGVGLRVGVNGWGRRRGVGEAREQADGLVVEGGEGTRVLVGWVLEMGWRDRGMPLVGGCPSRSPLLLCVPG